MKKILLSILILILYINSNAQSPLRINKFLKDSLAGNGYWYIYHDSTHAGDWGALGGGGGGGGAGTVTSVAGGFAILGGPITTTGTLRVDSSSGGVTTYLQTMKKVDSLGALSAYRIVATRNVTGGVNNYGSVSSGADNIILGGNMGNSISSGSRSVLIGREQGVRLTTASDIIGIGYKNLTHVTTGSGNSMVGISIGHDNNGYIPYKNITIGAYNVGYNVDSVDATTSYAIAADNIAIGNENLINLRTGIDNTAVGWGIMENADSASFNNAYGQYALQFLVNGHRNNAFGFRAGKRQDNGDRNVYIGDSSGRGTGTTTINNSVFIGANSRFTGTNLFNRIAIGDSALVSQDNFMALGRTGTRVGIGRATATEQLHLDSAILIGPAIGTTDGTIQWTGSDFQGRKGGAWKSFTAPSIADLTGLTSNSVYYVDNSGVITALALGASGTVLTSNGATSAPTFTTPAGGGDVSKVGTPVNNQVGVWTGDGTLEGDANLTFASSTLNIGVAGAATGILTLSGVTSGTITLQPASAAGTYTLTLPTNDGDASQFLQTDGNGVLTWATGSGGASWNGITDPTGDQALTFDAGESSAWTNSNTTEDLFTVNSSTITTSSFFSLNRTSTALAAGNNIMELVSSGANGTGGITATGMNISVTNTGTTSTNAALTLTASGATTNNAINVSAGRTILPGGTSAASSQSLYIGSTSFFDVSGIGFGAYFGAGSGYQLFLGQSGVLFGQNTAVIDFGQAGTFSTTNRIRMSTPAEGTVLFHSLGLTAATLIQGRGGENTTGGLALIADEGDDTPDTWTLLSETDNDLSIVNSSTEKFKIQGANTTLVETTATTFISATVASNTVGGGEVIVTVEANDATEYQSRTLRFIWTASNKAGTTTITIGTPEEVAAVSSGTLTVTITAVDAGSGVVQFKADATSSLTQTTLRANARIDRNF